MLILFFSVNASLQEPQNTRVLQQMLSSTGVQLCLTPAMLLVGCFWCSCSPLLKKYCSALDSRNIQ